MHITRIIDVLEHAATRSPDKVLVAGKENGVWRNYSAAEFVGLTDQLSKGLLALGIGRGDKVAIMSPNRPEWNICDFAVMQTGAALVPLYPTLADHDIEFILRDAGITVLFVSAGDFCARAKARSEEAGIRLYGFDDLPGIASWQELLDVGAASEADLPSIRAQITPDDLVTLIYTSGTTGTPKGVMLTHGNLLSNVLTCCTLFPPNYHTALSFLPLCHIFERMVVYIYFYLGISVYYAENMDAIVANMNEVKPDGFTTVPRLLEKVYDRIVAKGTAMKGIKGWLFHWALRLGLRYELAGKNGIGYELQLWLANLLVFSKWRAALGGNIHFIISGGAALQPRLARVFWAARIPVLEGYGLTETSPVIAVNGLGKGMTAFGTVGKPINDVLIRIADDGEILVKGPNVMKGYFKRPDLTAETVDADGYFHTGDIGQLNADGFLCITDRKKEIFKTAGGKYIAPQSLENKFKESPMIEQVMVVGENRKFASALIVPAFAALQEWCTHKGITVAGRGEMIRHPLVIDKYQRELDRYNANFGHWEQVKKFILLPDEWSIEHGEMTPKLSLKRKVIAEKYRLLIDRIYEG